MRHGIARSLKHRNYRLFFSGQSVSLIGTWLTRVATSWLTYRLTHSAFLLGIVSFASLMPTFLVAPLAGVLADRWNKHKVLIATQVAAALQSAAMAVLTLSGRITISHIVALSIVQGLINAFDVPVRQSLLIEMIDDRRDLPNAIALNSSMFNLARLVGPSFAGILIAAVGEGGCFTIDAVSYLAVIGMLLMMSIPRAKPTSEPTTHVLHELREGFRYAARSRVIVSVLVFLALVSFTGMPYMTLLPMIVTDRLAGDARLLGYLTAASGLGALGGALYLASRKTVFGLGRVVLAAAFTFGIGLIGFGFSRSIWLSMPLMLFTGLGMMVQMAASNTILQSVVDEGKRGRVMSLFLMAYTGMMPFGGLAGGYFADHIGPALTLAIGGALCCIGGLVFMRMLPEIRLELTRGMTPDHETQELVTATL